jgi:hypothetical protein
MSNLDCRMVAGWSRVERRWTRWISLVRVAVKVKSSVEGGSSRRRTRGRLRVGRRYLRRWRQILKTKTSLCSSSSVRGLVERKGREKFGGFVKGTGSRGSRLPRHCIRAAFFAVCTTPTQPIPVDAYYYRSILRIGNDYQVNRLNPTIPLCPRVRR